MEEIIQLVMLVFTVLYSYYLIDIKKVAFLHGTIASILTAISFIRSGIIIQGILFIMYGISYLVTYFKWGSEEKKEVPQKINLKQTAISFIFILIFTIGLSYFMKASAYPILDATTSALSIIGVYFLNKKVIEHAYYMCISNIGSIYICVMTGDYLAILTFMTYFAFNVWRIVSWNKIRKGETKDER